LMDGGIRRGTDVFKALALGASAVGIGKPVAYAMSAYGQDGIEAAVMCMKTELSNTMRLMGCKCLADIKPEMVNATALSDHTATAPIDYLTKETYAPLPTAVEVMHIGCGKMSRQPTLRVTLDSATGHAGSSCL
jgi:L-lactate dehydrogenase (cytochrome)